MHAIMVICVTDSFSLCAVLHKFELVMFGHLVASGHWGYVVTDWYGLMTSTMCELYQLTNLHLRLLSNCSWHTPDPLLLEFCHWRWRTTMPLADHDHMSPHSPCNILQRHLDVAHHCCWQGMKLKYGHSLRHDTQSWLFLHMQLFDLLDEL